jgi:hypothetical protein
MIKSKMWDVGCRMRDAGCRMQDAGCRMCKWVAAPRRDKNTHTFNTRVKCVPGIAARGPCGLPTNTDHWLLITDHFFLHVRERGHSSHFRESAMFPRICDSQEILQLTSDRVLEHCNTKWPSKRTDIN